MSCSAGILGRIDRGGSPAEVPEGLKVSVQLQATVGARPVTASSNASGKQNLGGKPHHVNFLVHFPIKRERLKLFADCRFSFMKRTALAV